MPLLGGLFGGNATPGPVVIPVPPAVPVAFRVYYVPGYPPLLPDDLRAKAAGWVAAHVEEPLRSALVPLLASPDLTCSDMAKTSFPPPLERLAGAAVGREEKERLEAAWQVVVVSCPSRLQVPMLGLWAAIAAGRSAALELKGALFDAAATRLTPIADYESGLPGRGTLAAGDHAVVATRTTPAGFVSWYTMGMIKFGLPEVEVQEAPPNLDLGPLVGALAQHLLDTVLTANHGREQPVAELSVGPELELAAGGRPVRFRVIHTPGHGQLPALVDVLPVLGFSGTQADFLAGLLA
jgi:hypothetical protein